MAARAETTYPAPRESTTALTGVRYAGFWPRVAARMIDVTIALVATFVIGIGFTAWTGSDSGVDATVGGALFVTCTPAWLMWFLVSEVYLVGTRGQSVGRMAVRIKVVQIDGTPMTCWTAFRRALLELLLASTTYALFYLSVATHPQHRGWHDRIMNTAVIHAR